MRVLITGGAGFIGRYVTKLCLRKGDSVTVLDNFSPQIHGTRPAAELEAEFREAVGESQATDRLTIVRGDVCDMALLEKSLQDQDAVVHLAAETGTGQSMYEVVRYEQVNIGGTAALFQCLTTGHFKSVRTIVLASSRAIYGEGKYSCDRCGVVYPAMRNAEALKSGNFEPSCPSCGGPCVVRPTDESTPSTPASFYGLTKHVQEEMARLFGAALNLSVFILRYQNVYGPGQSLRNPYTGILAIFSNQARENKAINIFEDGKESRDFVYVEDVARASRSCLDRDLRGVHTLNVGAGEAVAIEEVAAQIKAYFGSTSSLQVTGQFRLGDIRHSLADLEKVKSVLGYNPQVKFPDGIRRFLTWAETQAVEGSGYEQSLREMSQKGLAGVAKS